MAKKDNDNATEIDLTTYAFAKGCGACHPGGGPMEYDRSGNRYDDYAATLPADTLDGDYYKSVSAWQTSGVVEADCLICHLDGYDSMKRSETLGKSQFKAAAVAGALLGTVADNMTVTYDSDNLTSVSDKISGTPDDSNCSLCHAAQPGKLYTATGTLRSDMGKRGFMWDDPESLDVHNAAGLSCVDCHTTGMDHQIGKGHDPISTVRDDLDNTVRTCSSCHTDSGWEGAPVPGHAGMPSVHFAKLDCTVCHIPNINNFAMRTKDFSLNGTASTLFVGGSPKSIHGGGFQPVIFRWESEKDGAPKLFVGNPVSIPYWNDGADETTPVFAATVNAAYSSLGTGTIVDDTGDGKAEVNTAEEIQAMVTALKAKGVQNPVLRVKDAEPFMIYHNVTTSDKALGAKGCTDCHAQDSYLFSGEVMQYNYDISATAETDLADRYVSMSQFTEYSAEEVAANQALFSGDAVGGDGSIKVIWTPRVSLFKKVRMLVSMKLSGAEAGSGKLYLFKNGEKQDAIDVRLSGKRPTLKMLTFEVSEEDEKPLDLEAVLILPGDNETANNLVRKSVRRY